jgi:hypothetical protein
VAPISPLSSVAGDLPLDLPLWLERAEIAEEQRLQHIAANRTPDSQKTGQPDPEDAAPWWLS